jgi:hypothetical protein
MAERTRIEFNDYGYVFRADGQNIIAANRDSYGAAVAALISGGITFILACNSIILPMAIEREEGGPSLWLLGAGLGALALLTGAVCLMFYRVWKSRSQRPLEECLTVAIRNGEIFDERGVMLEVVQSASSSVHIDIFDRSRGVTRFVTLHAGGRRFRVFKADTKSGAEKVQRVLAEYGVAPQT